MNQIANHSDFLLKLDLQLFAEDDIILPDDYQEPTEPVEPVIDPEPTEPVEPTEPTETNEPPAEENPFLKVKYNGEEMTLDEARARELAQKGLNYDKVQERLQSLESDPRLSFVEQLAQQHGMDVNQYLEAVKQQQEQQRLEKLLQNNIPEEYAKEILDNRKFREQFSQQQEEQAKQAKADAEFNDFFTHFQATEGRAFDANKDQIPQSVWEATQNGVPLKTAYMEHQFTQMQQQIKTLRQNELNAKKAPVGSVTRNGSVQTAADEDDPFLQGFNSI
jgi:hypothetical protein